MTIVPVSLATQSNNARFKSEGSARLVNCYSEQTGGDAKAPETIYAMSGLDVWTTVPATGTASGVTGVRAMLATDDYLYVVAGRDVTAIDIVGAQTAVATLPADGDVYLAANRRSPTPQVALVSDGTGRIITGTSIATISDADLPSPTSVGYLDGYFCFQRHSTACSLATKTTARRLSRWTMAGRRRTLTQHCTRSVASATR